MHSITALITAHKLIERVYMHSMFMCFSYKERDQMRSCRLDDTLACR